MDVSFWEYQAYFNKADLHGEHLYKEVQSTWMHEPVPTPLIH